MTEEQELEIKRLEVNMSKLLTHCTRLQEQILALQTERDQLCSTLERTTAELSQARQQIDLLTTARAMEGYTEGSTQAHAVVQDLIKEVQNCISMLEQMHI